MIKCQYDPKMLALTQMNNVTVFFREDEAAIYCSRGSHISADKMIGAVYFPMFIIGVATHLALIRAVNKMQINMLIAFTLSALYYLMFWLCDLAVRNVITSKVVRAFKKISVDQIDEKLRAELKKAMIENPNGVSILTSGHCYALFSLAGLSLLAMPFYPGEWQGVSLIIAFVFECAIYLAISMHRKKRKKAFARIVQNGRESIRTPPQHGTGDG